MATTLQSFGKINIGLAIGPLRDDGYHELRTIYQTIALHDRVRVEVQRGMGIEIRCKCPGVPEDESNTCYRVADRVLKSLRTRGRLVITIEKKLPVQGGLGGASSNGIATMLALERELKTTLEPGERHRIAAEVGSDLPLFLIGGTVLGAGHGEQVFPLDDLPALACVVVTPEVGVSTTEAFAKWDELSAAEALATAKLTAPERSDKMKEFSGRVFAWLMASATGVPSGRGDRAETLLLDLVRAGIENDFERVVFPRYPELREVKRVLERESARYASISGSGSALYGLFETAEAAQRSAERITVSGYPARATETLMRNEYWQRILTGN
jgi:4-diphosphocytidyl-2-C-methyl-D-erythritol kinase